MLHDHYYIIAISDKTESRVTNDDVYRNHLSLIFPEAIILKSIEN